MAVFFALITLVGWAVGDLFAAISSRKIGAITTYFWAMVLAFIISSLYIPFAGGISDLKMFLLAFGLNIIHMFANISGLKGLEVGKAAIVGTLTGTSTLVTVLISLFIFGETLSRTQYLGILLILTGGILASIKLKDLLSLNHRIIFSDKGIIYALGACLGWGIYFAFVRIPAEAIGWFWAGYPLYILTVFLPLFIKDFGIKTLKLISVKEILIPVFLYSIFITLGDFSYNLAILKGFTSVVAPIADSFPVLFVILARFVFHERLTKQQKTGIAITLAGIVFMGFNVV